MAIKNSLYANCINYEALKNIENTGTTLTNSNSKSKLNLLSFMTKDAKDAEIKSWERKKKTNKICK